MHKTKQKIPQNRSKWSLSNPQVPMLKNGPVSNIRSLILLFLKIGLAGCAFPPAGKCWFSDDATSRSFNGVSDNGNQLNLLLQCDTAQKSFQFSAWYKLTGQVPTGQFRLLFRYETKIILRFKGLSGGNHHSIVLRKTDENPKQLGELRAAGTGKWIFVWLQLTANRASLAVRSSDNFHLENNKYLHKTFGKRQSKIFISPSRLFFLTF